MEFKILLDLDQNEREDCVLMITENGTKVFVPNDEKNKDWKIYQQWLADGNEPEVFEP